MRVLLRLLFIALRYPGKSIRRFSFSKIRVLKKALNNEPPSQIVRNFQCFINGVPVPHPNENSAEPLFSREQLISEKQALLDEFLKSNELLVFAHPYPMLSILLILYNKAELTLACLQSLLRSEYRDFELIIVDNHSTDRTSELLRQIHGAKIIRNVNNLHFIRANNQAYPHARGEYLLFLNNDTQLPPKTIGRALETIRSVKNCGAVGGKIILPEGVLQEAGSIIWNDGSCLGYGRNDHPALPPYNFIRETDYCSAAFLLTPTLLFREHGGFDPLFEPAYYEETDYCFWLQQQGYSVLYDPEVLVHHFEFGSGASEQAIALHRINQEKFVQKHSVSLKGQCPPNIPNTLIPSFGFSSRKKKRILYIDDRVPHNDFGSGFPRSNSIVNRMAEMDCLVTLFPMNFPDEDTWDVAYRDIHPFIEIALGYGLSRFGAFMDERKEYFDCVWVSRPHNMDAASKVLKPLKSKMKIVYDAEAIFAEREILQKKLQKMNCQESESENLIRKEIEMARIADIVTTVSDHDAGQYRKYGIENVTILGHCVAVEKEPAPFEERKNLLFVGNLDYNESPNSDSLIWFVREIFPAVQKALPGIALHVAGSARSEKVQKLKSRSVILHGRVDNLNSLYNQSRLFIAPTRFAAGIPFKVHEAAAKGVPVVATQLLAGQLGWQHDRELWATEADPDAFARVIVSVYDDKQNWERIRQNAQRAIETEMSPEAYSRKIATLLNLKSEL